MNNPIEIVIISLWCVGIFLLFKKDMGLIFSFVDKWYDKWCEKRGGRAEIVCKRLVEETEMSAEGVDIHIREAYAIAYNKYNWVVNPLWACLFCMSSFHTLLLKTLLHWEDITLLWYADNLVDIVITMVCVTGLNSIIYSQIKNIIK